MHAWRAILARLRLAAAVPLQALVAACPPDTGPSDVPPAAGVAAVGVVPWVINYNVPVEADDFEYGAHSLRFAFGTSCHAHC